MAEQVLLAVLSLLPLLFAAGVAAIAVVRTRAEPRRLTNGVWLAAGLCLLLSAAGSSQIPGAGLVEFGSGLLILLSPLLVVTLIVVLLINASRILRREGRSLGNLLSLVVGLGLLGVVAAPVLAFLLGPPELTALALIPGLGATYFGTAFLIFIGYSALYARLVRRSPASWVVVLGSGLSAGSRVPPLLQGRIRAGLAAARRTAAPLVVMSGGQGDDETLPEGRAMALWAGEAGAEPRILAEEESRNTEQNLRFTMELLDREGITGPGLIATSNYHTMRAAMLARELGIDAQAVGAPVARYYWPSAILREFAAILQRHWALHLLAGLLVALPFPALLFASAVGA